MIVQNFGPDFPENFKKPATGLLRSVLELLPCWVQEVYVSWSEEDHAYASMSLDFNYRQLSLTLHRGLFDQTDEVKFQCLTHEIMHCYNVPIADAARDILDRMFPEGDESSDPPLKELYHMHHDQLRKVTEQVNTDFTYAIMRYTQSLTANNSR